VLFVPAHFRGENRRKRFRVPPFKDFKDVGIFYVQVFFKTSLVIVAFTFLILRKRITFLILANIPGNFVRNTKTNIFLVAVSSVSIPDLGSPKIGF
jgi:hypothetical protein